MFSPFALELAVDTTFWLCGGDLSNHVPKIKWLDY